MIVLCDPPGYIATRGDVYMPIIAMGMFLFLG